MLLTLYSKGCCLWPKRAQHIADNGSGLATSDITDDELHTACVAAGAQFGRELLWGWRDIVAAAQSNSEDQKAADMPSHHLPFPLNSGVESHLRSFQHCCT